MEKHKETKSKTARTHKTTAKTQAKPAAKPEVKAEAVVKRAKPPVPRKKMKTEFTFGLHNLVTPPGSHEKKRILGRGPSSGHGKTSTRGSKGQTSRAGRDMYAGFEGGQTPLIRRIPKRGFNSRNKRVYQLVNLSDLSKIKETSVTLELLEQKGFIKDKAKLVKVLGDGEIKSALTIQAHAFSKSAQDKITQAGGKIELINA